MTLELTASRLIAKHVGSSLYTWTSVIGVVLAGITLGNWLGGWLADRFDRGRSLAWMYLLASISCASILWLDQTVATISRPEFLTWPRWIVTLVASIFLLPALALGATSPLVASMAIDRSSSTGSTLGNVYAWGALGSIVGTFLTGFYLIDVWGTRSIVGMTSATLGILAIVTAGHRMIFRTAVMVGWLQLLGWTLLAAMSTEQSFADIGFVTAKLIGITQSEPEASTSRTEYVSFSKSVGSNLHELGLLLKLRDDNSQEYFDESNYSDIRITETLIDGRKVKSLRLDKLIHSYYDQDDPLKLHYSYERAYAGITKRIASSSSSEPVEISLPAAIDFPVTAEKMPDGITLDVAEQKLRIEKPRNDLFQQLLALAPEVAYWTALERLQRETNKPDWGGFAAVNLAQLPSGTEIPTDLSDNIRYDDSLQILIAYQSVSQAVRDRLIANTRSGAWYSAVDSARRNSLKTSACFYGGGGFIFPRWFLNEYPGSERIDVAELDPAVYEAVKKKLGFDAELDKRIHTTINDARNFVDDRLLENSRRKQNQQNPIEYDFIYGDAFNDFSIPWHLTTREFLQKTRDLMSDRGVFLANIIDIYPRTESPGVAVGKGGLEYQGRLPLGILTKELKAGRLVRVLPRYGPLEIGQTPSGLFRINANRLLTTHEVEHLKKARLDGTGTSTQSTAEQEKWIETIDKLVTLTKQKRGIGSVIPPELKIMNEQLRQWIAAPAPFDFIEVYRIDQNDYVLGLRGNVSEKSEKELIDLAPNHPGWAESVKDAAAKSRLPKAGRFLGRYAATAANVFPNVYLFRSPDHHEEEQRDTFVMVCSQQQLELGALDDTGDWQGGPFAWYETVSGQTEPSMGGQMSSVMSLAEGQILTDDFAPVDNLLVPVFDSQE